MIIRKLMAWIQGSADPPAGDGFRGSRISANPRAADAARVTLDNAYVYVTIHFTVSNLVILLYSVSLACVVEILRIYLLKLKRIIFGSLCGKLQLKLKFIETIFLEG